MSKQNISWSIETDVVVVGAGGAGLATAINAHDHGAQTIVLEKLPKVGGTTILAGGGVKAARDVEKAISYLTHTQGGRVNDSLIRTFAEGLVDLHRYLENLAEVDGARIDIREGGHSGIYPFPGAETLYSITVSDIPGFDGYDWTYTGKNLNGQRFFKLLLDNVESRKIPVHVDSPVEELITDELGEIRGVWARIQGERKAIKARKAVVLASGGFEFNEKLKKEFLEIPLIYSMGSPGNTGDGLLLAQKAGASLWHTFHIHGSYGFKFPEYPSAFRIAPGGARNNDRPIAWILVDKYGKRFTNELHPAVQDTAARPLSDFNPDRVEYTRIPATLIFDENGRKLGRLANPLTSYDEHRYEWSEDNSAEVERGWISKFDTIEDLAHSLRIPVQTLQETIDRWNRQVAEKIDEDYGRPAGTTVPISTAPYYSVPVWPILTNTQGGPEHDEFQRVVDPFGKPIPRLYSVGELGSFFAHLYLLGGNLSETVISGRIAGKDAANLPNWDSARTKTEIKVAVA